MHKHAQRLLQNSYARKPRLSQGTVAECSQGRKDGNSWLPSPHSLMNVMPGGHQEQSVTNLFMPPVQFSHSVVSDSLQPHGLQHARTPCAITSSRSLLKLMSIESVMPSNHLILCYRLLLLPSLFPSIRVFSEKSVLHIRWPKYWNFSFCINPSDEYSWLISFRMHLLDLLAVQETLKRLLRHHSSNASILRHSAFFIVQLSHPYMTTGKIIALTSWTFVGKVMSLFFNMLSRLVITFLPRSKHLLISWLISREALNPFMVTSDPHD